MAEKKIGGTTYRAGKMPAREAQKLLLRLGKIVGPGLAQLVAGMRAEAKADRDAAGLTVITEIVGRADVDEADELIVYLCEQAMTDQGRGQYEQIIFDHHFHDDLMVAWQVAWFVLEVNFRDFFGAAGKSGLGAAILSSAGTKPAA